MVYAVSTRRRASSKRSRVVVLDFGQHARASTRSPILRWSRTAWPGRCLCPGGGRRPGRRWPCRRLRQSRPRRSRPESCRDHVPLRRARGRYVSDSVTRGSPPWNSMQRANTSRAHPDAIWRRASARRVDVGGARPADQIHLRPAHRSVSDLPDPRRAAQLDSATSTALPAQQPSGWSMSVMRADIRRHPRGRCPPGSGPDGEVVGVFMKAPRPGLDVRYQGVDSTSQLLAHDAGGDRGDGLHGSGDVARGVDLLSAGAIRAVWPMRRRPIVSTPSRKRATDRFTSEAEVHSSLSACRPVCPSRGR